MAVTVVYLHVIECRYIPQSFQLISITIHRFTGSVGCHISACCSLQYQWWSTQCGEWFSGTALLFSGVS